MSWLGRHAAEDWPDNRGEFIIAPSRHVRGVRAAPREFTINYATGDVLDRIGIIDWPPAPPSEMVRAAHRRALSHKLNVVMAKDSGCAVSRLWASPQAWGIDLVLPRSHNECELCSCWGQDPSIARHESEYGLPFKGEFTPQELVDLYRAWAVLNFEKMTLPEVITAMREPDKFRPERHKRARFV